MGRIFKSRKNIFRAAALAFAFVIVGVMSSCMLNPGVENLLSPPRAEGEYGAIQKALEEYIKTSEKIGSVQGYTLKYPRTGEERSALYINPYNSEEAFALYRPSEGSASHINFLTKAQGKWKSSGDVEGEGINIDRVDYVDIDGDGKLEILVGWEIDFRDNVAVIYRFSKEEINEWTLEVYNQLAVGRFTGDKKDNVITFYASTTDSIATASIWSSSINPENNKQTFTSISSANLDGGIKEFGKPIVVKNDKVGVHVYVDGNLPSGQVTELIYWDRKSKKLIAPFYDPELNSTALSYRDYSVPAYDIDGDGNVEWSAISPVLSTEGEKATKVYMTKWYKWSFDDKKEELAVTGILNLEDGYFFKTQSSWDSVLFEYNAAQKQLILSVHDGSNIRRELLKLKKTSLSSAATSSGSENSSGIETQVIYAGENVEYRVWFDVLAPTHFTLEDIKKSFSLLSSIY